MNFFFKSSRYNEPIKGHLKMGDVNPEGTSLIPNSRYLEKGDRPWLPVMGEFHYSRYSEERWEEEILKMKAAGIDIIASYIFWIHHEEEEGKFNWSGNCNLRRFVELCGQHGMYFLARIGPWCHGECRNGGFPDWLLSKGCKLRTDDPTYLHYVRILYREIAKQLEGLYYKDGGPIIGIQLENELQHGSQHLLTLKRIAQEEGMLAPLYTVTGWGGDGGAEFPELEVIPMFGGYPEAPWEQHVNELKPNLGYFFSAVRNDAGIGNDLFGSSSTPTVDNSKLGLYPYFTCEIGGGIQYTYHRRPLLSPDDVASVPMVKLASGANMLGYYMFHGGSNPIGRLSTMQESRDTNYPNDYPVISYDFQAAIGQYGQIREHYHILKCFHLFLRDFGHRLAPMVTVLPDKLPKDRYDTTTARMAIRVARDGSGFIFFNNHQRYPGIGDIPGVQAHVHLDEEVLSLPSVPFTLKKDAYFFWPFNFKMEDVVLKQATVQPLCLVNSGNEVAYFFIACEGVAPEYIFKGDINIVDPAGSRVLKENGDTVMMCVKAGMASPIRICTEKGDILLVTLTPEEARRSWKGNIGGQDVFVMCQGNDLYFKGVELVVYGENPEAIMTVYPSIKRKLYAKGKQLAAEKLGIFERYRIKLPQKDIDADVIEDKTPLPNKYDKYLFVADDELDEVRQWKIVLPKDSLEDVHDVLVRVNFIGDVIQAFAKDELVNDGYYNGGPFDIALSMCEDKWQEGIIIKVSPLTRDKGIYLQKWPEFTKGRMAELINVEALPVYNVKIKAV